MNGMRLIFSIKLVRQTDDGEMIVDETAGTYDFVGEGGNVKNLMQRLRILFRRELIGRSLLMPTPEDRKR